MVSLEQRRARVTSPLYVPPGWPSRVRPPGAPDWEVTAVEFLLDCCPSDYRGYPVLRRHPAVLARFASDRCSETAVVAGTVAYLLTHQNPEDLPAQVDLEDVAAAYDDFPAELRRWLDSPGPTPPEGRSQS